MKIALAQIDTTVGALEGNVRKIIDFLISAERQSAELVVFPELTLTGYPPKDLLDHPSFIEANLRALEDLARQTAGQHRPGLIVGFVDRAAGGAGKGIHNSAALIENGRVLSRHAKSLLPTYDVFDEARHFDPAPSVRLAEFRGLKIALTICEDFWNDKLYWKHQLYAFDPVEALADQGPGLMVTISASPFSLGKPTIRAEMYGLASQRYGVPLVHVNLVGGNDNLLFDGQSNVWGADGTILHQAAAFEEQLSIIELAPESRGKGAEATRAALAMPEVEQIHRALVLGIRDYVSKCGFRHVLIGLSGGVDSALTAALAVDALGADAVTGVAMPSEFSSKHSIEDAEELAALLGIQLHTVSINEIYDTFNLALRPIFDERPFGLAEENLQARIRGNILMTISNKFGWLVLTTGNKSELATGYCTLYGDMSGGLAVLSDLVKTRVYELARWINRNGERIPRRSIEKPPSAELRPNQLDTDTLPPYDALDPIVSAYIEEQLHIKEIIARGHDPELVRRVIRMIDRNEYKRQQMPIGLKVTGKAFGSGRRMPIARGEWCP